jgi:hypothetical protein
MEPQCEAAVYGDHHNVVRCPEVATVKTEDGSLYCESHKNWDDE